MSLKTYPVLLQESVQDVSIVLRDIIRTREEDIDYVDNVALQAGSSVWRKLQWAGF